MDSSQTNQNGLASSASCPLCRLRAAQPFLYHRDRLKKGYRAVAEAGSRLYFQCAGCSLVYVPRQFHLSPAQEKAYYDLHENSLEDPGYETFLGRCADPLISALPAAAEGLDFGCGPAPLLARLLENAGHRVATYDLYYQPDATVLARSYDFIVSTEVVEHLSAPGDVIEMLWQRVRRGGVLALMTKLVVSRERFASWHYIRDPTHIAFFSRDTFSWLAAHLGAELEFVASDVVFLRRPV
ncbi:class I SAM-dependent methyltransferase [Microbulbifer sp. HZ11]|uniref:class I SAM-dependent methyltransferase n=1 Tax=unclassified Microbulbifer TaxID=2619833 RepID=UPI00068C4D0A|nr:class I SAM-dependent methyltransferase [Microbulbifer sp. HZ11]